MSSMKEPSPTQGSRTDEPFNSNTTSPTSVERAYGSTSIATLNAVPIGGGRDSEPTGFLKDGERAGLLSSSQHDNGNDVATTNGEKRQDASLLACEDSRDEEDDDDETARSCTCGPLSAITLPLGFCLFGYFVNKLVTEVRLRRFDERSPAIYLYGSVSPPLPLPLPPLRASSSDALI